MTDFDAEAATWDDPAKAERAQAVADAILDAVDVDPATRLLEYGAGTGLLSQALQEHVGRITLVDTSEGMRHVMRDKVEHGALPDDAEIWSHDLADVPATDERFDLVATLMTMHHVDDVDAVLRAFAALLRPGGHLAIADLVQEDGSFHGEGFEGHHGFDPDDLATRLARAGFTGISARNCYRIERDGRSYPVFLSTSRLGDEGV